MLKTLLVTTAIVVPAMAFAQSSTQGLAPAYPTSNPSNASLFHAKIEPSTVRPGDTVHLEYGFEFSGGGSSTGGAKSVQLIGLPANTIAVGTSTNLNQPITDQALRSTDIKIMAPAAAGVYPLKIRVSSGSGGERIADLGNLTITDEPGRITNAQLVPSNEPAVCSAGSMPVAVRYTVEDPNGASDVKQVMIQSLQPVAGGTVIVPQNPVPGSYTVTQQANGTYLVTPVGQTTYMAGSSGVIVAPTVGTAPLITSPVPEPGPIGTVPGAVTYGAGTGPNTLQPLQPGTALPGTVQTGTVAIVQQPYQQVAVGGMPIQQPTQANVVSETVQAAARLPCLQPFPAPWQVGVVGIDVDDVTGQPRQTISQ